MAIMMIGLASLATLVILRLPPEIGLGDAWDIADATEKLNFVDFSFDPKKQYTIWSALLGGTIIFLAYFGTDQSQVQRFLAGKNIKHQRGALGLNAAVKIPFQYGILVLGVLMSIQVLADPLPLVLQPRDRFSEQQSVLANALDQEYSEAQRQALGAAQAWVKSRSPVDRESMTAAFEEMQAVNADGKKALSDAGVTSSSTANLIMPHYLRHRTPAGLLGLLLVAILAAALSSMDSELNSLSTVATLDILRMNPADAAQEARILRATRNFTVLFGALAAGFALQVTRFQSLVEGINDMGSLFYGSLLGVFLLAWFDRAAHSLGVICGLISGVLLVVLVRFLWNSPILDMGTPFPWLYQSTLGVVICVLVGSGVSRFVVGHRGQA
jgi:Na+/proline symporter